MKANKRKINKITSALATGDNVKIAILFIPLLVLLVREVQQGEFTLNAFFDTSVLVSFLAVFICESLAAAITYYVNQKTEDDMKLDVNYERLVKKYPFEQRNMVSTRDFAGEETGLLPVIVLCSRHINSSESESFRIQIEKSEIGNYHLPKQVADHAEQLFAAHEYSTVYNNTNIRLDDFLVSPDGLHVTLRYSFTTYFDSLITNRAMDYPIDDLRTVREIYEPGPMLSTLAESKLSNHLGFNGFVELSDGNIIFVFRSKNVSIAKRHWSQSVGASLKCAYCLDDNRGLTVEGLSNAIRREIHDELKVDVPDDIDLCTSIFAFYRDIVEGGKPQFLFYYKATDIDKERFLSNFDDALSSKAARRENKEKLVVDGERFAFLTMDELRACEICADCIKLSDGTRMAMMPSSTASIAMLLENLG